MNAEGLLAHYERIADAPDAIARLRRFILILAVRGKLFPQDPTDEAALKLKRGVAANDLRMQVTRKNVGHSEPLAVGEKRSGAPAGWEFVRLGAALDMINGRAFKPTDWISHGLPIVRIQNLNDPDAPFNYCDPSTVDRRHLIHDGEFLISWSGTPGTSFGAFIWNRGNAALNQHIFRCIQIGKAFSLEFLRLAINSQLDILIGKAQGGVGLQHVTKGTLESLLLPVPPPVEQHRIVEKVAEMMALCDRLESSRARREGTRDWLTVASLGRLDTPDPDLTTFTNHTRFALDVLHAFTARPDQIKQLRRTILNLAVRGKLVPQDPKDESASELLKRIAQEKARLVKMGMVKKLHVDPVSSHEMPFVVPRSWAWTRLGSVGDWGSGSTPPRGNEDFYGGEIRWLKSGELNDNRQLTGSEETVTDMALASGSFRLNRPGDVLMAMYGATIGRVAILAGEAVTNQAVCGCTPFAGLLNQFLFVFLLSRREEFRSASEGGAQPNISKVKIVWTPLPLPPLAEQHRIVAKVDELTALCDRLEASLTTGDETRRRLLDALLRDALAPIEDLRLTRREPVAADCLIP
jgi:type I restriction enzyme S subunit